VGDGTLENFVRDNRLVHVDLGIGQVGGQEVHVEVHVGVHEEESGGIADQDILG
jgi:hypothetical protein